MPGKFYSHVSAPPLSEGDHDSVETAFDGDLRGSQFQVEHRITGADTLGQPITGYNIPEETFPFYLYLHNESGHNEALDTNTGRTLLCGYRVRIAQMGQGDAAAYNASIHISSTKSGSTSFLANPAGTIINGAITAGVDGAYLNPLEFDLRDNGYDVACVGAVLKMTRTNSAGAKDAFWHGFRAQSQGSEPIDAGHSVVGPALVGFDLSFADLPDDGEYKQAAATLKAGQRIYLNANGVDPSGLSRRSSNLGDAYLRYNPSLNAIELVVGGGSALQVYANQVAVPNGKAFKHGTGDLGFFNTTPCGKKTVTGSRGGNAALASLLTQLASYGLITDSTTA